ncbi:MAG TPA: molecular chaperone, partial [Hyphomicrobiaceae bacterium]|nr:molecular chaperone [Hyphomicrobiaceae bacterium]
ATQVFRLQWAGEPQLARSESFMVYVNQIPVRLQNVRHAVQVVSSMGVVVNVAPPSGMPDLKLVGTSVVKEKGKRFPAITVENPTNIHALLPESKIVLTAGSWSRTIEPNEISTQIGVGLVEPGKRRRFVLPVDLPPGVGQIHASVEFKPSRR